ncbi:MAG: RimK family alpha-L-glutamate ligase [Bacilli bacterium]
MKTGYLVVNSFKSDKKFNTLYQFLLKAFHKFDINLIIKKAEDLYLEIGKKIVDKPDFVLFWDKDIYLCSCLEKENIPTFNSAYSIFYCDNKIYMYDLMKRNNIKSPKTFYSPKTFEGLNRDNHQFAYQVMEQLSYPVVIKEAYGSFGEQVYLIENKSQLDKKISELNYKDFVIQEYIASSKGRDVRINIVDNKYICAIYRENKDDFRSNVSRGGTYQNYQPSQEFIDAAIKMSEIFKCDFCGVDIMFDSDNSPIVCEINSSPQFVSTFEATGINLGEEIAKMIKNRLWKKD